VAFYQNSFGRHLLEAGDILAQSFLCITANKVLIEIEVNEARFASCFATCTADTLLTFWAWFIARTSGDTVGFTVAFILTDLTGWAVCILRTFRFFFDALVISTHLAAISVAGRVTIVLADPFTF
jgi:hypothetical protein